MKIDFCSALQCLFNCLDVFDKEPSVPRVTSVDSPDQKRDSVFHSVSYISNNDRKFDFPR